MVEAPHPESVICTAAGREVSLKLNQCVWSGDYPPNSMQAVQDCYRARVARAEIDLAILKDQDFLVVHDLHLARATDGDGRADETNRSELAHLLQPIKDRVTFGGGADWNLRRLHQVDPTLRMGFTISDYLDWQLEDREIGPLPGVRGAYSYLDAHPLARERLGETADYLRDRLGAIVRLVPDAREIHVRPLAVERMLDDGLTDLADLLHAEGMLLDVWTLNAGTPRWRERLDCALAAGADVITTDPPRDLARAARRV